MYLACECLYCIKSRVLYIFWIGSTVYQTAEMADIGFIDGEVNFTFLELDGKPRAEAVSSKLPMLPPGGLAKQFKASTKKNKYVWKSWLVGWLVGKSVFLKFEVSTSLTVWWVRSPDFFFVWEHLKNMRVVGSWHLVERGRNSRDTPKMDCW